jgi:hypothetical protein
MKKALLDGLGVTVSTFNMPFVAQAWAGLKGVNGSFSINATDLDLPTGPPLNTADLPRLGTITVMVPEPSRVALLMLSAMVLLLRRQRTS